MRILAIDTCLAACQVALVEGGRTMSALSEPMMRGHQERLAAMVRDAMGDRPFAALDRIAVTVGPGSFTGLRVGLAFAKGLGAALTLPVLGIGSLEALAEGAEDETIAAIDAKRGFVYAQAFVGGAALTGPAQVPLADVAAHFAGRAPRRLIGPGAAILAAHFPAAALDSRAFADPVAIARLGEARTPGPPTPLYLRAPDAKLPGGKDLGE